LFDSMSINFALLNMCLAIDDLYMKNFTFIYK